MPHCHKRTAPVGRRSCRRNNARKKSQANERVANRLNARRPRDAPSRTSSTRQLVKKGIRRTRTTTSQILTNIPERVNEREKKEYRRNVINILRLTLNRRKPQDHERPTIAWFHVPLQGDHDTSLHDHGSRCLPAPSLGYYVHEP